MRNQTSGWKNGTSKIAEHHDLLLEYAIGRSRIGDHFLDTVQTIVQTENQNVTWDQHAKRPFF